MQLSNVNMLAGLFDAFAYETLSVTSSVKPFTSYKDSDGIVAKRAVITVETARISYRYDGGTPTTTNSHTANPNDAIVIIGQANIKNFRVLRKDSTDASLKITYER